MAEDVQDKNDLETLLGDGKPADAQPEAEAAVTEPEIDPNEHRKALRIAHEETLAAVKRCEKALVAAKVEAAKAGKAFMTLATVKIPLHEMNRRQQEITRGESERRQATKDLLAELSAGTRPRQPGPARPPLFSTGAAKEGE